MKGMRLWGLTLAGLLLFGLAGVAQDPVRSFPDEAGKTGVGSSTRESGELLTGQDQKQEKKPDQPQPKKQEQDKEKYQSEFVVSASPLKPTDLFDTPYSADVVTAADVQLRRLSRTIPDALKEIPGINVQKTSNGHGSPFIRGFTGFRNIFLIDGIRLNNSIFREGPNQYWNTVDEFIIDRLEIVRGPSSVLYGSDSIGGSVNAYTKEPKDFTPGFNIHGRSFYRFAGAERSHTVREESWGNVDDLGWFVGGTFREFDDINGGRHVGEMENTGYGEYDADAKLVYQLSKTSKLILAFQHTVQDDVPRTHRTNRSKSWHGTTVGSDVRADYDQQRDLAYLQYHATMTDGLVDSLRANLSWHRMEEKFNRETAETNPTRPHREVRELEVDTPGVWVQAGKQTSAGFFTAGIEYYQDRVDTGGHDWLVNSSRRDFARGEIADDARYDLLGLYLQDEFSLGKLDVTPGVRFSRASVDAGKVDPNPNDAVVFNPLDDTYSAVTGSVRLLYHVTENWNAIGGWGMGFRAPSLDDSTAIKLVMSGALDLPAENLDPERSHTFDLGVRGRYPTWEVNAFGFYTILRDFIQRVPAGDYNTDGVTDNTKRNFSDGWVYGFELGGLYRVTDEVSVFADWAYARGEADTLVAGVEDRQPLAKMNPMTAHLGARYQPKESKAWVEGVITAAAEQTHLPPSDESDTQRIPPSGTPGYTVYTLRGGVQVQENVNLTAAVENITNKDYRIHGSGQNEPGTNFILGLDVRF